MDPLNLNLPTKIETDRLVMRRWVADDAQPLYEFQHESWESFHKWSGGILAKKDVTQDDMKAYIDWALSGWDKRSWLEFPVFEKSAGKMIGTASFHHLDWTVPKGRIGCNVCQSEEGKGYATEIANVLTRYGFEVLQFKRLEIRCALGNPASVKIPRKLGYQFLTVFEKNKVSAAGDLWDLEIHVRFDADGLPNLNVNLEENGVVLGLNQ